MDRRERGKTILLSTHDMAEAEGLANRVAILRRGRIVACGSPRELTAERRGLTRISVQCTGTCLTGFTPLGLVKKMTREMDHIYFVKETRPAVMALLHRIEESGEELVDLRVECPSLEERFLELTEEVRR